MPYQPTFPKPYLETIDASLSDGNNFKCLINAKDTITAYEIKILSATTGTQICSVRGAIVSGTQRKYSKIGTGTETEITSIPSTDTIIPLKGSYNDNSWLQVNIPNGLVLTNGQNYKWNIKLTESSSNITSNDYYFEARTNPSITFNVPELIESSEHTFTATYSQLQNIKVSYFTFNLYLGDKLIDTTGEVFSSNIEYKYEGFLSGNTYDISLMVVTDSGVIKDDFDKTFYVEYAELQTLTTPVIDIDNYKTCVDIDFSASSGIVGHLEGTQTEEYNKFKNLGDEDPVDNNAISLFKTQNLYWNKVNEIVPLNIPNDFTLFYNTHCSKGYNGTLIELTDETGEAPFIRVRYDSTQFYCKIGNEDELIYNPYVNGEQSAVIPFGESTEVDEGTLYLIYEDDIIEDDSTIITNDLGYDYWWKITVRPYAVLDEDKFVVVKSTKYVDSIVEV